MQIKDAFQVGFNRYDSVITNIVWPLEGVQSLKMMTDSECREEPLKIISILIIFLGVCSFIIRPFVILISVDDYHNASCHYRRSTNRTEQKT